MKKRFLEPQIAFALRQAESGTTVAEKQLKTTKNSIGAFFNFY